MSKAKIIIEYKGKRYRVGNRTGCNCKRDCSLFEAGVCNSYMDVDRLPCDQICDAFIAIVGLCPWHCFKEVKTK